MPVCDQMTIRVGDDVMEVIAVEELPENAWILYSLEEVVAFVNNEEVARWDQKARKWQWREE